MKTRGSLTGSPPSSLRLLQVDHQHALGHADLDRGRPMPGAAYIVSNMSAIERAQLVVDAFDGRGDLAQTRVGNFDDAANGHGADLVFQRQWRSSDRTARAQRLGKRPLVEIVELAADRQAVGELGQADREFLQPLGEVMGGGLAFQRRVHRQHDLVDPAGCDALDQAVDARSSGRTPSSADSRPPST